MAQELQKNDQLRFSVPPEYARLFEEKYRETHRHGHLHRFYMKEFHH